MMTIPEAKYRSFQTLNFPETERSISFLRKRISRMEKLDVFSETLDVCTTEMLIRCEYTIIVLLF
jgi:hypothetical protein